MIRTAKFENFKGLRDVAVTFDRQLTVLVGPNGSGKTSVLQGIQEVIDGWSQGPKAVAGWDGWQTRGVDATPIVWISDGTDDGFGIGDAFQPERGREAERFLRIAGGRVASHESRPPQPTPFAPALRPRFRAADIAAPSVTTKTPPQVEPSGRGLPSLLAYLKLRDDELFDRIEAVLCKTVSNVRKLRVDRSEAGGQAPESLLFDTVLCSKVPASQMSDGTLYILALIVAVLGPHRPKTMLIDDIDQQLHPKAQYELVSLLKQFLKEIPDLQIIATAHSPYLLDRLEADEVRVTGLAADGSVVIAPLDEHPSFARWKDAMTPGEFWSHTGEDWLKDYHSRAPKT